MASPASGASSCYSGEGSSSGGSAAPTPQPNLQNGGSPQSANVIGGAVALAPQVEHPVQHAHLSVNVDVAPPGSAKRRRSESLDGTERPLAPDGTDVTMTLSPSSPIASLGGDSSPALLGELHGSPCKGHLIVIDPTEDVAAKLLSFAQRRRGEVVSVFQAFGPLSSVTMKRDEIDSVTYQGHYELITMNGCYFVDESGEHTGGITVTMTAPDGKILAGVTVGKLIAAGPVWVTALSFVRNSNPETESNENDGTTESEESDQTEETDEGEEGEESE